MTVHTDTYMEFVIKKKKKKDKRERVKEERKKMTSQPRLSHTLEQQITAQ